MRTLKFGSLLIACAALLAASFPVGAQQAQPKGQDAPPPPKLEKLEEGEPPAVTIKDPKGQQTVTEKRDQSGKVTEIKVNKGKNTYYLKPNVAPGNAMPGDAQSPLTRPAQWQIHEFGKPKKQTAPDDMAPAPPPIAPATK